MTRKKEGAAIRKETRAHGNRASHRQPTGSLPERRDGRELSSRAETVATCVIGTLFLYVFMWLVAAY